MQIQNSKNSVSTVFLRSGATKFNQNRETFHDVIQRTLNNKSNPRPPKIELTGILVPCNQMIVGKHCRFRLDTDSNEYPLSMSDTLMVAARKIEWEEVTVKGFLDPDDGLFEVERIVLKQKNEPLRVGLGPTEPYIEVDQYNRTISQRGKIDIAADYLAS